MGSQNDHELASSTPRIMKITRFAQDAVYIHGKGCRYLCLFVAACSERSVAVGHVCIRANSIVMNRQPKDVSDAVLKDAQAIVILDAAGWRRSKYREVHGNITQLKFPPCFFELYSSEQAFQCLK